MELGEFSPSIRTTASIIKMLQAAAVPGQGRLACLQYGTVSFVLETLVLPAFRWPGRVPSGARRDTTGAIVSPTWFDKNPIST